MTHPRPTHPPTPSVPGPAKSLALMAYEIQQRGIQRMIRAIGDGDSVAERDARTSLSDGFIASQLAHGYTTDDLDRNGFPLPGRALPSDLVSRSG